MSVEEVLRAYLQTRRSIPAPQLAEPGPDSGTLKAMLRIAARTPDHGKLAPWRLLVYPKAERRAALPRLRDIALRLADEQERARCADKTGMFAEAPVVVGVLSRAAPHPKIPVWEQELSAGAVCMNLVHAAFAHGFAANWITGWYAYDPDAARYLGAQAGERFCGLIHIGSPTSPPTERPRPDLTEIAAVWSADGELRPMQSEVGEPA